MSASTERNPRPLAYPDFLVRTDGVATALVPEDAKLSRRAKGGYILQLGVYAELLEALYDIPVQAGTIHVAAGEPERFDLRRTRYILQRLMRDFERFVADESRVTKPLPCAECAQCDFNNRCEDEWRKADNLFFVAGVNGAQVVKLAAAGVHRFGDAPRIAESRQEDLITYLLDKLPDGERAKVVTELQIDLSPARWNNPELNSAVDQNHFGFAEAPAAG